MNDSIGSAAGASVKKSLPDQFSAIWDGSDSPPDVFCFLEAHTEATARERANVLLIDQFWRWRSKVELPVEKYFETCPDVGSPG